MGRPVVTFASLVALALPRAQGQTYGHVGIELSTATSTESPSTISQAVMVARVVDEQVALQTGACASSWTDSFSTSSPMGSSMAPKGYGTTVGCQPAGCLYAHEGGGGETYLESLLRDVRVRQVEAP